MRLGKIIGKVWATRKEASLHGLKLYVMQPLDHHQTPQGPTLIAVDAVGAGESETVFWVAGAEATLAFEGRTIPSDASIVGIVDSVHTESVA